LANDYKCGKCGQPVSSKVTRCIYCGSLGPHLFAGQPAPPPPSGHRPTTGRPASYPSSGAEPPPVTQRREPFIPPAESSEAPEERPAHVSHQGNQSTDIPVSLNRRSPILDDIERLDEKRPPRNRGFSLWPSRKKRDEDEWDYAEDRQEPVRRAFDEEEDEEEERPVKPRPNTAFTVALSLALIIVLGLGVLYVYYNFDDITKWLASPTVPEVFRPWDQPSSGSSSQPWSFSLDRLFGSSALPGTGTQGTKASDNTASGNTSVPGSSASQGDTTPPVISDIAITSVTEFGATIAWRTNEPAQSKVMYKTEVSAPANHDIAGKPSTMHRAVLTQLESGKTYFITLKSWDDAGNISQAEKSFQTLTVNDITPPKLVGEPQVFAADTTATISWKTDEKAVSQVKYGSSQSYEYSSAVTGEAKTEHSIFLTGLSMGTSYHLQLISTDAAGNVMTSPDRAFKTTSEVSSAPYMGSVAPNFKLKTLDGGEVMLSQFRGRKVLLNFWASWCSPCKVELPHIQALWEKIENNNDVMVLTVAGSDSDMNVLKSVVSGSGFTFTVALDDSDDVFNRYGIVSIPKTFFIDKEGVIRRIQQGMFTGPGEIEYMLNNY
jgi:peroxiredoxin